MFLSQAHRVVTVAASASTWATLHEARSGPDDAVSDESFELFVVESEFGLQDLTIVLPERRRRRSVEVLLEGRKLGREARIPGFSRVGMFHRLKETSRFELRIRHQSMGIDHRRRRDARGQQLADCVFTCLCCRPGCDPLAQRVMSFEPSTVGRERIGFTPVISLE